jgi:hypothetical protein
MERRRSRGGLAVTYADPVFADAAAVMSASHQLDKFRIKLKAGSNTAFE